MGEFRIGRTFARHSYPDTPRGASAAFASNFALGPGSDQAIATAPGTAVFTAANGSAVSAGTITADGAPITPNVTGDVLVEAAVEVRNTTEGVINIFVFARINGTTTTTPVAAATLDSEGYESIPVTLLLPGALALGATAHVNLVVVASSSGALLTTSGSSPNEAASTMYLREVPLPTG